MLLYRYWWRSDDSWFWQWWNDQRFTTLLLTIGHLHNMLIYEINGVTFSPLNKATYSEEDCWGANTTPSFPVQNLAGTLSWNGRAYSQSLSVPMDPVSLMFDSGTAILLARSGWSLSPIFAVTVGGIRSSVGSVGTTRRPNGRRFFLGASWISAARGRLV